MLKLTDRDGGIVLTASPDHGFICSSIQLQHPQRGWVELLHNGGRFPEGVEFGMSPVLFPSLGRLRRDGKDGVYEWGGREHGMDIHGFAKDLAFKTIDCRATGDYAAASARLTDDDKTRAAYPFAFTLELTYRLKDGAIEIEPNIQSEGPYGIGFHPFFRTPLIEDSGQKSDCTLTIPATELWDDEGLVPTGVKSPLPEEWPLADGMNVGGKDIDVAFTQFTADKSGVYRCQLVDEDADFQLTVEADARVFPEVVLYTTSDSPFVCVENWTGPPNGLNNGWGVVSPLTRLASTIRIIPRFGRL